MFIATGLQLLPIIFSEHPSPTPNRKTSLSNFSTDSILGLNSFEQSSSVGSANHENGHVLDLSSYSSGSAARGCSSSGAGSTNNDMDVDMDQSSKAGEKSERGHMQSKRENDDPANQRLLMIANRRHSSIDETGSRSENKALGDLGESWFISFAF